MSKQHRQFPRPRRLLIRAGAGGAIVFVTLATPGLASAGTPQGEHAATGKSTALSRAKKAAEGQISVRRGDLSHDTSLVIGDASVSAAHRDELAQVYSHDNAELSALARTVAKDSTVAQVKEDLARAQALRVLALVNPVTGTVVAADDLAAKASELDAGLDSTTSATAAGRGYLGNARTLLAQVQFLTSQSSAHALALSPTDARDGVTPVALTEARAQLAAAGYDYRTARKDAAAAAHARAGSASSDETSTEAGDPTA